MMSRKFDSDMLNDTIIAISTPIGFGGLGIIRLSGGRALELGLKLFRPKKAGKIPARKPVFGNIHDFQKGEGLDEGYLTYFPGPRSYTREDVVEITCHGSPVVLEEAIRLGTKAGARLAHPGEFTLRAYLNGRIDILQAEAVNDLIQASSLQGAKLSFRHLEGGLSRSISGLRKRVVELLAGLEARIEFPDEEFPAPAGGIIKSLSNLAGDIRRLIAGYDTARLLTEGVSVAIVGCANVGKSTLFNALLENERAIVSPLPGTTRDYLTEKIKIRDTYFSVIDMAGLGKTVHPVEEEGIRRGRKIAVRAGGILLVLDASRKEKAEDLSLIEKFKQKKAILVFNKADLPRKADVGKIKRLAGVWPSLDVSALEKTNIDRLKAMVYQRFVPRFKQGEEMISHLWEKTALEEVLGFLEDGLSLARRGYSDEIFAEEIRKTLPLIGRLTGEIRADDVMNEIFSKFCLGK